MWPSRYRAAAALFFAASATPSTPAAAQSNVTIYGLLDSGIEMVSRTPNGTVVRQTSSNLSGTHFGFRGFEELGHGYKTLFALETGFNIDSGTLSQGGRMFGRQAFVGLSGPYGSITLGRQQNLLDDIMIWYDPMRFGAAYSAVNHDLVMAGRADNAVKYSGTFNGFTMTALYSKGYDVAANGAGTSPTSADEQGSEYSLGMSYARGAYSIGAVVDQRHGRSVSQSDDTQRRAAIGIRYEAGHTDLYGGYRWLGTRAGSVAGGGSLYWFGASHHFSSAFLVTGSVYRSDIRGAAGDPMTFVLATEYYFSKRTELFASTSYALNRGGSNLGVGGWGVNIEPDTNQLGVVAGIRHRF